MAFSATPMSLMLAVPLVDTVSSSPCPPLSPASLQVSSSLASLSCTSMSHSKNTLAGAVTGINNEQSINPAAHEDMNANPQQDGFLLPSPAQQAPLSCLNLV